MINDAMKLSNHLIPFHLVPCIQMKNMIQKSTRGVTIKNHRRKDSHLVLSILTRIFSLVDHQLILFLNMMSTIAFKAQFALGKIFYKKIFFYIFYQDILKF